MTSWWPAQIRLNQIRKELQQAYISLLSTRESDDSQTYQDVQVAVDCAIKHINSAYDKLTSCAKIMEGGVHERQHRDAG